MAKDRTTIQTPDPGVGTPPRDSGRSLDVLQTELAKIQVDGDYTKKFLGELQADMRDIRDRMAKLEVKVDHLPSKGFIVVVVTTFLVIAGGLMTIAPKLWSWAGTATISASTTR
ncbi:MAG: hypothetical protein HXX15_02865 [Rhodopseudomonas sp.]|uniref:hypothetical protein n=1 Tax=Rhodopseudomonas sp. TaxID=1078 RepID=UPI001800A7EE|nr:hypothetical protein [Rhodopseudomonas sp.]NVN85007.1 hypothetical protein [Rhodopseudomonas sp.]